MGNGDHRTPPRATQELDAWELSVLTHQSAVTLLDDNEDVLDAPALPVEEPAATPAITLGRARTLHDPMTTEVLAEIARSQAGDEAADGGRAQHPNTLRRPR